MIFDNKETFEKHFEEKAEQVFGKSLLNCSDEERFAALAKLVSCEAAKIRPETENRYRENKQKHVYYFSAEFLVGRFLRNYLLNLGVLEKVESYLKDMGMDLDYLCSLESDPALGNGGLGRLAACFLDSMAFLGINATGVGIRYRYGLFRQHIESGKQIELADNWLKNGYQWETRKPREAVTVRFGGTIKEYMEDGKLHFEHTGGTEIRAVPYDVDIIGYGGKTVNYLRLWRSDPRHEYFDLQAFNRGDYANASRERIEAEALSYVLYPDDSIEAGREMRLKQEYFFVCAGITDILRKYKLEHGKNEWDRFPERVAIHINDTHPALCVPELMRQLIDIEGLEWEDAWDITCRTISYTNHTVLPEALEKWSIEMFTRLLPRVYRIVEEIDRRYKESLDRSRPDWGELSRNTAILWDGQVRMANLSVIGSYSVNGVAALHSEILKADTLKDFYTLTPEKFNNKTNGVSHRRFMIESNPALTKLITSAIGDSWINDPDKLTALLELKDDPVFLADLNLVKYENKCRLAEFIARTNHIEVDPSSVFDVQVKRIHAYKRQHLNIFKVMALYNELKANPDADIPPATFIFAGKAAASYVLAKDIITLICTVADIVNSDPDMHGRLKVIFLENYNVSLGQIVYPAADISEQISTAGKEASGTGNMKFMFNGAVTLGTMDGANVEIHDLVGDDNIYIFGLNADEALSLSHNGMYSATEEYNRDYRLTKIMNSLTDGSLGIDHRTFSNIYGDLMYRNDEYFVLKDFACYMDTWRHMCADHAIEEKWSRMSLVNIAKAGTFSSDRTIREYAKDIWKA